MKAKTLSILVLTVVLGGSALWVASHRLMAADTTAASRKISYYTCPMHPSVKADKPGACPICGMTLVPVYSTSGRAGTNAPPAAVSTNAPATKTQAGCSMGGCSMGGCCR